MPLFAQNDQSWGAHSAIDGRRDTAWSSNRDGDKAFIENYGSLIDGIVFPYTEYVTGDALEQQLKAD